MTSRAEVAVQRAATIETSLRGGTCAVCITSDYPDQPCDHLCATCLAAQRAGSAAIHAALRERAESYAADARKFGGGLKGVSAEDCKRYAAMYRTIADELRKVAGSL